MFCLSGHPFFCIEEGCFLFERAPSFCIEKGRILFERAPLLFREERELFVCTGTPSFPLRKRAVLFEGFLIGLAPPRKIERFFDSPLLFCGEGRVLLFQIRTSMRRDGERELPLAETNLRKSRRLPQSRHRRVHRMARQLPQGRSQGNSALPAFTPSIPPHSTAPSGNNGNEHSDQIRSAERSSFPRSKRFASFSSVSSMTGSSAFVFWEASLL